MRIMDMEYPSGLRHVIFNSATPIDDGSIRLVQILFRNDRAEDCSTAEFVAWDKAIIEKDREILESMPGRSEGMCISSFRLMSTIASGSVASARNLPPAAERASGGARRAHQHEARLAIADNRS